MRANNDVIVAMLCEKHGQQPRRGRAHDRTSAVSPSAVGLVNGVGCMLAQPGLAVLNAV